MTIQKTTSPPSKTSDTLSSEQRAQLEQLYAQQLSAIVLLARTLGKPSPIVPREERRRVLDGCGTLDSK